MCVPRFLSAHLPAGRPARPAPTPLRPPLLSALLSPVVYFVGFFFCLFALCPPRTPQPVVRAAPVSARLSLSASVCGWPSSSRYIYIYLYIYFSAIVTHDNSVFPRARRRPLPGVGETNNNSRTSKRSPIAGVALHRFSSEPRAHLYPHPCTVKSGARRRSVGERDFVALYYYYFLLLLLDFAWAAAAADDACRSLFAVVAVYYELQ